MAGRALVFSNPAIIELASTRFIPYAGDQWYLHRQQDADGEFFWKVVKDGHMKHRPPNETRQGVYAATPEGDLLASSNPRSGERALEMLNTALASWKERPAAAPAPGALAEVDAQFHRAPPAKGLVLNDFSRIPLSFEGGWNPNQATGRDHVWLTETEWRSLLPKSWQKGARYPVPQPLADRLVRFHLVDNIRGEPDVWRTDQVQEASLFFTVLDPNKGWLKLEGSARMLAPADPPPANAPVGGRLRPERGYEVRVEGYLDYDRKKDRVTRCDFLAWGEAWGHGTYTPRPPEGRFPLVHAFSLAGNRPADRIPPQGLRHPDQYFKQLAPAAPPAAGGVSER